MTETVLGAAAVIALLLILWWALVPSRTTGGAIASPVLPPGVTIASAPLLTEVEVFLYNLMRLAVRDHYLVFAQVPLWSFVSVEAMGKARSQVLNQMALKRVDFVLVHPGTRQVEQVVQLEEASPRPPQAERQRVIESVLDAAGIKLVKLRPKQSYTIPDLAVLLGLESEG
jgi:hypothetical protein